MVPTSCFHSLPTSLPLPSASCFLHTDKNLISLLSAGFIPQPLFPWAYCDASSVRLKCDHSTPSGWPHTLDAVPSRKWTQPTLQLHVKINSIFRVLLFVVVFCHISSKVTDTPLLPVHAIASESMLKLVWPKLSITQTQSLAWSSHSLSTELSQPALSVCHLLDFSYMHTSPLISTLSHVIHVSSHLWLPCKQHESRLPIHLPIQ